MSAKAGLSARLRGWARETGVYWRESARLRDFARLMRVRLSQSKIGPLVTPRPITVSVDLRTLGPALWLRSHTTDISVLKELVVADAYRPLTADAGVRTVADLGANTGLSYRWMRHQYPNARFLCVEPEPGNLELLRRNAGPDAIVVQACVGGHARTVSLVGGDGEWGFRMTDAADGRVPVVTMESLLEDAGWERVDVLKCDIEGAEAEVFEACEPWIGRIGRIMVEAHTDVIDSDGLLRLIAERGGEFAVRHVERSEKWEVLMLEAGVRESAAAIRSA
jgi:FkbM family methyltransferase